MKRIVLIIGLILLTVLSYGQVSIAVIGSISSSKQVTASTSNNMLADSSFTTGTPWSFGTYWTHSSGTALYTDSGTSENLSQSDANMNSSFDTLTNYSFIITVSSTGTAGIEIFNSSGTEGYLDPEDDAPFQASLSSGTDTLYFITPDDIDGGGFGIRADATNTTANFNIDNLYIQERTLGSEMITDGDMSSSTNWTLGGSWSISGGVATFDDTSSSDLEQTDANMAISLESSTYYRLTFDIVASVSGQFDIENYGGGHSYVGVGVYTTGSYVKDFWTPSDIGDGGIRFDVTSGSASSFTIDNISLKKWQDL